MEAVTLPRPDLAAYRRAVQAPFPEIVGELAAILGKKLTAFIGGVKDTRVIERWMQGRRALPGCGAARPAGLSDCQDAERA